VVGPSASLYGNNAFFAVVNVVTRRGHDVAGGEVTANAGSSWSLGSRVSYGSRLGNGLEFLVSDLQPAAVYLDSRADGNHWALYAQDQLKLPGPLTLTAGLRYDRYQAFGGTTSPRVGLVFQRDPALTVKGLSGRAFRAPNEYELHYTMVEPQQPPQRGDPGLPGRRRVGRAARRRGRAREILPNEAHIAGSIRARLSL